MKLIDYLNALPLESRDSFAARCGTSFDYLRQIGYGNRPCKEALAIKIERESDGALVCEDLCPDSDWAFIRASHPAPARRSTDPEPEAGHSGRNLQSAKNIMEMGVDQPVLHTRAPPGPVHK